MADLHTESIPLSTVADLLDPPLPRDETLPHVTGLLRLGQQILRGKNGDSTPSTHDRDLMAMGRIWEAVVRPDIHRRAAELGMQFQPQVILRADNIIGSLDGLIEIVSPSGPISLAVVECKLRFARIDDPRGSNWMDQVRAYCHMAGVVTAWMPVLYLPRGEPGAEYRLHKLNFTQQEIGETWEMLRNLKRYRERRETARLSG